MGQATMGLEDSQLLAWSDLAIRIDMAVIPPLRSGHELMV